MTKISTEAIMSCPECGSKFKLKMPLNGKHINSKCVFCQAVFGINDTKDCCVYCTYSNRSCPASQRKQKKE